MSIFKNKTLPANQQEERNRAKRRAQILRTEIAKQKSRVFKGGLILSVAWQASSYWTFQGYMKTAEETATASFTGSVQALLAAIVSAVVVAGCCALLLGFSGSGEDV